MTIRGVTTLLLAGLVLTCSGCVSGMLARKIVAPPNRLAPPWPAKDSPEGQKIWNTYRETWRVAVGPPSAELAVAVIEPGDYALRFGTAFRAEAKPRLTIDWSPRPNLELPVERKGTVVLLHGFLTNKEMMLHWAVFFAQQGYRAVLVDLRGHGESSGDWITYGAAEAGDLVQVMDDLERRGLAPEGVHVFGVSYGAVMAVHWAARDARVRSLVALQPYSDPRRAVVQFARGFPDFRRHVGRISDATFATAVERAAKLAGFRWDDVNVLDSMRRLTIPVRLYHGDRDTWIPPEHSDALLAVAPEGSRFVRLPRDDHAMLSMRLDPLALDALDWIENPAVRAARTGGGSPGAAAPAGVR